MVERRPGVSMRALCQQGHETPCSHAKGSGSREREEWGGEGGGKEKRVEEGREEGRRRNRVRESLTLARCIPATQYCPMTHFL